jgi:hypothetical protein
VPAATGKSGTTAADTVADVSEPPGKWNASRLLLIAGVAVGVLAVVSWFTLDNHGTDATGNGSCQVPAKGTAGTEPPPAVISTLATPFGAADVTFTESAAGSTVYGYCFDVAEGQRLIDAIALLHGDGYTQAAGDDATRQQNFTKEGARPYGVSLTVTGDLNAAQPVAGTQGGVSIVWQDEPPK